jgi:hypothetical protein
MKKMIATAAAVSMAVSLFAAPAFAAELKMVVKGKPLTFANGTPFVENGTSLMPLRDLLLGLGVQASDIGWNNGTVTATYGDTVITLKVGDKAIYKNGEKFKDLEVPAKQLNGRVYLPARAVAEALGNKVGFDAATNSVIIDEAAPGASGSTPAAPAQSTGSATVNGTFVTKEGFTVKVSGLKAAAGQVAGFVFDYNPETAELTILLADGSKKTSTMVDATKITFSNGHTYTGKDYKGWFRSGGSIVATLNADGSVKEMTSGVVTLQGVVSKVEIEEIDNAVDADGNPIKVTLTDMYVTIEGKAVRFSTSETLKVLPKAGDTVEVKGSIGQEIEGLYYGHLVEVAVK